MVHESAGQSTVHESVCLSRDEVMCMNQHVY